MTAPLQKLNSFQNVNPGQTANLPDIAQGMTYEGILLELGGTFTKPQITGIRITLGGKKIWDITGTHLDTLNAYCRRTASAVFMPIWFANPNAKTRGGYLAGAIDTSNKFSNFSMEVDISGAAIAPTLAAHALLSLPIAKEAAYKNMFRALLKATDSPGGAGEFSIKAPIGSNHGAFIRALHFFHANITQLQVRKDSFLLLDRGTNAVVQYFQNELRRTAQAGLISWDPTFMDIEDDAPPTRNLSGNMANYEFLTTLSAADTLIHYSDLLGDIDSF